jgi:hypothetical protein
MGGILMNVNLNNSIPGNIEIKINELIILSKQN